LLLLFLILQIACSQFDGKKEEATSTPRSLPTATYIPTRVRRPTITPKPLVTDTPVPTEAPAIIATLPPPATPTEEAVVGIVSEIEADLKKIGLSSSEGHLAWSQDQPVSLNLNTYREDKSEITGNEQVFSDFVFKADITWDSSYGWIWCGLIFRADSNIDKGAYYLLAMGRGYSDIGFSLAKYYDMIYVNNDIWEGHLYDVTQASDAINITNGATNSLIIVVRGNEFVPYINGAEQELASDSNQVEGMVGFVAWQQSGETTCTFDNAWVWALD
jgi:hypothetical protein